MKRIWNIHRGMVYKCPTEVRLDRVFGYVIDVLWGLYVKIK